MDEPSIRPCRCTGGESWTYRFAELGIDFGVSPGSSGTAGSWDCSS